MPLPDGSSQVFSQVTRFSVLDVNGYPAAGSSTFTTDTLMKATLTPQMETGVDLANVNSNGDLIQHYKHGDMAKYYNVEIDVATPDPILHALLTGGTVLTDSSSALTTPVAATAATATTGGTLATGSYTYGYTACNQYGESVLSPTVSETTTTATSTVTLTGTAVAGAAYYRWYGRTSGGLQLLAETLTPSFTDTGAITPAGAPPAANSTAGPGTDTGYQAPTLGIVGNPNGVGIEFWGRMVKNGYGVSYLPYNRWVVPGVKNLHETPYTLDSTFLTNSYTGEGFENPNWGAGPFGDWQFDSSKVFQYARAAATTLPTVGLSPVPATA